MRVAGAHYRGATRGCAKMPPEILVELKLIRLAIEDLAKLLGKDYQVTLREARSTEEYTLTVERKHEARKPD